VIPGRCPDSDELLTFHFTKSLLDILNKLIIASSYSNKLSTKCWLNNKNVYKVTEACVCEYYAERFFQDFFESIFSEENLVKYIQLGENIIFNKSTSSGIDFEGDDPRFYKLVEDLLQNLIPSKYLTLVTV
jgi:hypothetical protein